MLRTAVVVISIAGLLTVAQPAVAQDGDNPIFAGGSDGEGSDDVDNGDSLDRGLIHAERVDADSVSVASQETTAYSLEQDGTTNLVWEPPGWLATCETEQVTFGELESTRSATAAHYATVFADNTDYLTDDTAWVVLGCVGAGAQVLLGSGVPGSTPAWSGIAYPIGEPPPGAIVRWLIADALAKVQVPVQAGSSAPNGEDAPVLYQLETVVWVDPGVWQPTSAGSSLPGASVTVTATPVNARFEALPNDSNDPEGWADCGTAATEPWTLARDEALVAQGCVVTFKQHADDPVLRSELTWAFSWVCSPGCGGNDFGGRTITRVNERPVTVLEYLVVES